MKTRRLRVLHLGNAFPSGMAGQLFVNSGEGQLWQNISRLTDLSSVGSLPGKLWEKRFAPKDDSPGLDHELVLWDRNPALWHRWNSWRVLCRYYLQKVRKNEKPDVIVVRNLQHVFNYFVKWVRRQPQPPPIVLELNDSGGLGEKIPFLRRLRYKFKPMQMLEEESLLTMYDAGILSGITARRFFEPRGAPWLWQPAVYKHEYQPSFQADRSGPVCFGYFGALSKNYAILPLVHAFLKADVPGTLHICGYGEKMSVELEKLARLHPNLHFDGFLPKESDCLPWAQKVDVLINSRLPIQGQENSFPSKVLEYGIAGKAILSTRTGGVEEVLGKEGAYFETDNFEESLQNKIREISALDRGELQRRGQVLHERIRKGFSSEAQAQRIVEFLEGLVKFRGSAGA